MRRPAHRATAAHALTVASGQGNVVPHANESAIVPRFPSASSGGLRRRSATEDPLKRPLLGPGALVTAAFVGPGTVATCTLAGARTGYGLVWALAFSVVATIILQDMAARLGRRGLGLGTALVQGRGPGLRAAIVLLVLGALAVGNAAYEAGNMVGAVLGLEVLVGQPLPRTPALVVLGVVAGAALWKGGLTVVQRAMTGIVILMSLAFGLAYLGTLPHPAGPAAGLVPSFPLSEPTLAVALIGTTVVPYNLFLHASACRVEREALRSSRMDTVLAIGLGGAVSFFILGTAAELGQGVTAPAELARALETALGFPGRLLMGVGLLAAGLTSALTAPLATGLVVDELFPGRAKATFRWASLGTVAAGVVMGTTGLDPLVLIVTAQAANGVLLPVVIAFLLVSMNRRELLGADVNSPFANVAGGLVFLVGLGLGARLVLRAVGWG